MRRALLLLVLAILLLGTGLSACGRKGPLEPPPDYQGPTPEERRTD